SRKSTSTPLTSAIQTSGFWSTRLGSIQAGSMRCACSASEMTRARPSVPYVDGPDWQAFFLDVLNGLAACGHMSGLFARKLCPLALMKSDCEGPYQCCGLYARGTEQGVLRRRCRPVVRHVEVSPSPNSLSLGLLPGVTVTSPAPYAGSNMSLRNVSPLVIMAQMTRASLLASATEASRADFFFSRSAAS